MRPRRFELAAFGPFPDQQIIDSERQIIDSERWRA